MSLVIDPLLTVVIPTIDGRAESLERTIAAYKETCAPLGMFELLVIENLPNWPAACNEGARQATGDPIHFGADDLVPLEGWWRDAFITLEADELPAPVVFNYTVTPDAWDNSADGPDGALTHFTRVPLMTRSQYDRIGEWPEIDYGADVWVSEKGRTLGIQTRMVHSYAFVHHWHQHGRLDSPERLQASEAALNHLRNEL